MKARLIKDKLLELNKSEYQKPYNNGQIAEVGIQYQEFLDYIHSLNYDDLIEYAEKSGHFKTLDVLEYLKKKTKFI